MRICSGAGCLRVIADDVRYCDECKPKVQADDTRSHTMGYNAALDRLRKSTRWQKLRDRVARAQPMCCRCQKQLTQIVDHIIPAEIAVMQAQLSGKYMDRWAGYFIRSNLQGLCRICHAAKTIEDKGHNGPWPDVVERDAAHPKRRYLF